MGLISNWMKRVTGGATAAKKEPILVDPIVVEGEEHDYTMGNRWGRAVTFSYSADDKVSVTYFGRIPKLHDVILTKMASGKIGRWLVTKVEPCRDPRDMAFLEVDLVGYKEVGWEPSVNAVHDWKSGKLF